MDEGRIPRSTACLRFDAELMAFLEGEQTPFVAAHARECEFCGVVLADLELLRSAVGQLDLEEPPRSVWANVRAALRQEGLIREREAGWSWSHPVRRLADLAPVGALLCLVVLGLALTGPMGIAPVAGTSSPASLSALIEVAPVATSHADPNLTEVVNQMEGSFKANEKFLAPEVRETYDQSLNSLNDSIQQCELSLQQEPANSLAYDYLQTAYSRKAEVLSSALEFTGH